MPKIFNYLFFFLLVLLFWSPVKVLAEASNDFSVSPRIIDEKARAKDILEYQLKIKNNTDRKIELYAIISDLTEKDGAVEFDYYNLDKTASLAKWINIKRGQIELGPGEEISEPMKINVNLAAKPGKYYSSIMFAPGSNPEAAKTEGIKIDAPKLMINVEVMDETIEKAEIKSFNSLKNTFFEAPVAFETDLKNIGNVDLVISGNIHIYNKRGEEVGTLDFNKEGAVINPENSKIFSTTWDSGNLSGNFKAKISLKYGSKEERDLEDIIYFMVLPWKKLLVLAIILVIVVTILTIIIFKKTYKHHHEAEEKEEFIPEHPDGVLDLKNRE